MVIHQFYLCLARNGRRGSASNGVRQSMNRLKTAMLLAALTALFLWAGSALGGRAGLAISMTLAAVMNVAAYWFSDRVVLRMYRAHEVGPNDAPGLYGLVQELASRAHLP